ncbi:MAG: long-chain-fatty-acid--CoA ligase [Armatimonadetes bacterium]|nr:long-chain-fatty-acid--CoA ligase [Armatimonadota bacterium]
MRNLTDLWTQAATKHATRIAVIHDGREYTYAELDHMIGSFAAGLREDYDIAPGDRVALVMPNCLHSIVCYLGCIRAGATALPINIRLKAGEMRFMLEDAGARLVIVHKTLWETVQEAIQGLQSVEAVVGVGFGNGAARDVSDMLSSGQDSPPYEADSDEVAAIIYTSGTTGLPKGAMITHGNVLFNVQATIVGHGFRPDDVHLLVVPLFHVTGLNTIMPTAFHQGATVVVSADPSPANVLDLIERHQCTTFFAVPTTMILLVQTPGIEARKLPSLRLLAYSGAPMPVRAIERLRELYPDKLLHNFFGLTETTSCTSVLPSDQALVRPESIGRVVPGLEARIVDDAGRTLPPGQVGELLIRGPSIVKGYYNRPEATAEAIVDGWLHTGDTALMDSEGFIFLQGRKKELIIVGGENVYPVEVENVLTRHPAVAEAAVIGEPHAVFGEVVRAVVVLRPGHEASERDLRRWCSERLASYKVPQAVEFVEALPRNPSGKVVKRRLKGEEA